MALEQKFLEEKLDQLKKASGSEKIEAAVEAFSAGATIGEIRQALGRGQSETMPVIEPQPFGPNGLNRCGWILKNSRQIQGKM